MIDRIVTTLSAALLLLITAQPAVAAITAPVAVPEPATMTLFGLGAGGAFIARKLIRRR